VILPVTWCDMVGKVEVTKNILDSMEKKSKNIKINLRKAQSKQNSYDDRKRSDRFSKVGD